MLPAVRTAARQHADESERLAAARAISASFNQQLDALLARIDQRGRWLAPTPPIVERFDLAAVLGAAVEATSARGGNAVDACFDTDAYRASGTGERVFHIDCAPVSVGAAPRFNEFAFWDDIHPTGTTHAAIGTALAALF
jgi:phospholipase/lecithinase/hemolysin